MVLLPKKSASFPRIRSVHVYLRKHSSHLFTDGVNGWIRFGIHAVKNKPWVGVALEGPKGMNNGSSTVKFDSGKPDEVYRYFVCQPKHGVMTSPANVTLLPGDALPGMEPIPRPDSVPGTTPGMAGLSPGGTTIPSPPPGMRRESMHPASPVDTNAMTFEQQMDMAMFGSSPTGAESIDEAYADDDPEVM